MEPWGLASVPSILHALFYSIPAAIFIENASVPIQSSSFFVFGISLPFLFFILLYHFLLTV